MSELLDTDETLTGEPRCWVSAQRAALSLHAARREDGSAVLEALQQELERNWGNESGWSANTAPADPIGSQVNSFRRAAAASLDEAGFCPVTSLPSTTTWDAQSSPFS